MPRLPLVRLARASLTLARRGLPPLNTPAARCSSSSKGPGYTQGYSDGVQDSGIPGALGSDGISPPGFFPPPGPGEEPWIPEYIEKFEEPIQEKRARLLYQSRKRGMLENGLLLGSFASKHLPTFTEEQLVLYDRLINLPSNDWEIFYWVLGQKETPEEFESDVMDLLKEHAKNKDRESRVVMPELN